MSWTRVVGILAAVTTLLLASCGLQVGPQLPQPGAAPAEKEDIVYLSNGQELRGIIIEQVPGTSLSLRTREGRVWLLPEDGIQRVEERSVASARAPGMPVVRMADSKLVHQWVRIDAGRMGTRVGRVLRMDPDTLFMREAGAFRMTKIPRAAIRDVVVSTRQSRRTADSAVEKGLIGGVGGAFLGLFALVPAEGAAAGAAFGLLLGAVTGYFGVEHKQWRQLEMSPPAPVPPVSSTGVGIGLRVRP